MAADKRKQGSKRGRKRPSAAAPSGVARVFWSGRSQAVRLPKAFRFDSDLVSIRQEGNLVILQSLEIARDPNGWPLSFWDLAGAAPDFDIADRAVLPERGDILKAKG